MPVPLSTLDALDTSIESPDANHVMGKRKRAKAVYWVGIVNGRPVTKLYDNLADVLDLSKDLLFDSVKKLHPELDRELINKIQSS
jgi:hypothetical protein